MTISPVSWRFDADGRLHAGRRLARIAVAPASVVEPLAPFLFCLLAHLAEFFGRGVAAIGGAGGQHLLDDLAVACGAGELVDGVPVPGDAEPVEAVEDRLDRLLGGALAVGILDPQQHLAAAAARVEPIEQRRPRAADVEEAGGRGGEAGNDLGHLMRVQ